jgi:hypothetical protein
LRSTTQFPLSGVRLDALVVADVGAARRLRKYDLPRAVVSSCNYGVFELFNALTPDWVRLIVKTVSAFSRRDKSIG